MTAGARSSGGMGRTSIAVVGVGGQGSVFVTRVLGEAALRMDLGVVSSELHGMAQRGGVVAGSIIIGQVHGPIVPPGEMDLLVALEPLEALRALPQMRRGAAAVVGRTPIMPFTVSLGAPPYPDVDDCIVRLRSWLGRVEDLNFTHLATEAGEPRAAGAAALGALAGLGALPIPKAVLRSATSDLAPPAARECNERAFDAALAVVMARAAKSS